MMLSMISANAAMLSPVTNGTANLYAYLIEFATKGPDDKNATTKQKIPISESQRNSNITQNKTSHATVNAIQQTAPKKQFAACTPAKIIARPIRSIPIPTIKASA